jgi:hypothetical protein
VQRWTRCQWMCCQSRKDPDAERATDARSASYGVRPPSGVSLALAPMPVR